MTIEETMLLCTSRDIVGNLAAIHGEIINLQKCILAAGFNVPVNTDDLDKPIAERVEHLLAALKEPF